MGKKIGLQIAGRRFEIDDVDDEFSLFLEEHMKKDFNVDGNNDAKSMLLGYVRKTYELYLYNKKIAKVVEKIEKEENR